MFVAPAVVVWSSLDVELATCVVGETLIAEDAVAAGVVAVPATSVLEV